MGLLEERGEKIWQKGKFIEKKDENQIPAVQL